jgi:hypothetical protein
MDSDRQVVTITTAARIRPILCARFLRPLPQLPICALVFFTNRCRQLIVTSPPFGYDDRNNYLAGFSNPANDFAASAAYTTGDGVLQNGKYIIPPFRFTCMATKV